MHFPRDSKSQTEIVLLYTSTAYGTRPRPVISFNIATDGVDICHHIAARKFSVRTDGNPSRKGRGRMSLSVNRILRASTEDGHIYVGDTKSRPMAYTLGRATALAVLRGECGEPEIVDPVVIQVEKSLRTNFLIRGRINNFGVGRLRESQNSDSSGASQECIGVEALMNRFRKD